MARNIRRGTARTAPGGGRGTATADRYKREEEETPYEEEDRDSHYQDEEEERPRARGDAATRRGWGAARKQAKDNTDFAERLTLKDDDSALLKFVEDEPFVVFAQHWQNKKPLGICGDFAYADCPLCDVGMDKSGRAGFNVIVLVNDAEDPEVEEFPRLVVWEVPPSVVQMLEDIHLDDRKGPLDKNYIEVTRYKKKNNYVDYKIETVKERDVEEDWDVPPLTEDEIAEFVEAGLHTDEDFPYVTPYDKLVENAKEVSGRSRSRDDDDDDDDDEDDKPRGRRGRDRGTSRRRR